MGTTDGGRVLLYHEQRRLGQNERGRYSCGVHTRFALLVPAKFIASDANTNEIVATNAMEMIQN